MSFLLGRQVAPFDGDGFDVDYRSIGPGFLFGFPSGIIGDRARFALFDLSPGLLDGLLHAGAARFHKPLPSVSLKIIVCYPFAWSCLMMEFTDF